MVFCDAKQITKLYNETPTHVLAEYKTDVLQMTQREACSDQQIFLAAGGDRTRDL